MTRTTVTFMDRERAALRALLFRDDLEYAAIILFGLSRHVDPWSGEDEIRFLAREIVQVPVEAFHERTKVSLTWSTGPFFHALKRAEAEGLVVGVMHSHPNGPLAFSPFDDIADQELMQIASARMDRDGPLLFMVMDDHGEVVARSYDTSARDQEGKFVTSEARMLRVLGERWHLRYPERGSARAVNELDRQIRAFGLASTEDLGSMRVGVVGCGGTGSAVASLLARVGVRQLALFDDDIVDGTNLNRLHFSTRPDASLRRRKVDVVAEGVAAIGLDVSIVRFASPVDAPECRDALLSCDVVFGCTDDHLGRNLLNRISHFYLLPIIDMGLAIEPNSTGGYDTFDGRVTVVQPGYPCQLCRGLIKPSLMLAESLRRNDPRLYRERRRAGYVAGEPNPSPVVVTFTTELAAMAVNELFQRLNGFRGEAGSCSERVRRFDEVKDADTVPGGKAHPYCELCGKHRHDARGDVEPFLDQVT